jgi:hypothetical protein
VLEHRCVRSRFCRDAGDGRRLGNVGGRLRSVGFRRPSVGCHRDGLGYWIRNAVGDVGADYRIDVGTAPAVHHRGGVGGGAAVHRPQQS